ncbi:MAG TPA: glycosyltransferase family 87 protein [Rhizomicrobium sp.]
MAANKGMDWTAAAFGAALAYLIFLAAMFLGHFWLRDAGGTPIANDFIDVFAAGKMTAAGHAAAVYDWQAHRAAEVAVAGEDFVGYYGWHYPPPFLFIATALSRLPYFAAFLLWVVATLPLYVFAVARIAGKREAVLWACAFPAVALNAYVGQNGFVTAGLIGAMLLLLEDNPILSGVCLGLLTYKPQFGLLFPIVFLASGQWRVLASASATALCLIVASILAFGFDSWIAFFHSIPHATDVILTGGHAGWNKLQTVYGFARWIGAGNEAAWSAQISIALLMALGVVFMWRGRIPFELKAAALCAAVLLATPYAYIYDFPLLAISVAFLYRHQAFSAYEAAVLLAVCLLIAAFPWVGAPLGLAATLLVTSLISRRARKIAFPHSDVALQRA